MIPSGLVKALRARRLILFAGAGISAGLGLPNWSELLDHMARDLGYDPRIFRTFGDPWTLAQYYAIRKHGLGSLRSWMDTRWHDPAKSISGSRVHQRIVELDFPIIYTTNYDRWLEKAYEHHGRDYVRVVTVEDIALAATQPHRTPIVKFHGDFDLDSSLVLTETHYMHRLELEAPLDVHLRSDLLGRSVLFLGYSLTDPNIRRLLFKLRSAWESAGLSESQPPSFLFTARPNPVQDAVLGEWGVRTVTSDAEDPGMGLLAFLDELAIVKGSV